MKKNKIIAGVLMLSLFAAITAFHFDSSGIPPEISIGSKIPRPDIKMKDISGKEISLNDVKTEKGLMVIFSCNTCPYVIRSLDRIKESAALAKKNNIGVILVNSNEAQRGEVDSPAEMKKHAEQNKYDFYYVVDVNSALADAFGATRTPHCFLFDKKGLAYRGAIDDNVKNADAVKEPYLKDAILAVAKGEKVKTNSTKSIGCTIKRLGMEK